MFRRTAAASSVHQQNLPFLYVRSRTRLKLRAIPISRGDLARLIVICGPPNRVGR